MTGQDDRFVIGDRLERLNDGIDMLPPKRRVAIVGVFRGDDAIAAREAPQRPMTTSEDQPADCVSARMSCAGSPLASIMIVLGQGSGWGSG